MSFPIWAVIIGALLIVMALSGTLLKHLPASASMLYLAVGCALGPLGWSLMTPDLLRYSATLEIVTATLAAVAVSIVLHGISVTPLMTHIPGG